MKVLSKGLVIVALFFGVWMLLSQIDFVKHFRVKEAKTGTEKTLGEVIWNEIEETETVIFDDTIVNTLDSLLLPICKENGIERDSLKVHIIDKDEVNAFAMPDNHLVVYTGLIKACKNEQALLGVLGHEIAHIEGNHVMQTQSSLRSKKKIPTYDADNSESFGDKDTTSADRIHSLLQLENFCMI
jgi:predicted Zn-dependent protease